MLFRYRQITITDFSTQSSTVFFKNRPSSSRKPIALKSLEISLALRGLKENHTHIYITSFCRRHLSNSNSLTLALINRYRIKRLTSIHTCSQSSGFISQSDVILSSFNRYILFGSVFFILYLSHNFLSIFFFININFRSSGQRWYFQCFFLKKIS